MQSTRSWEVVAGEISQILSARTVRSEITLDTAPAPARLATHAAAILADVTINENEIGSGRLVILYEPTEQEAWEGNIRCVAYVRADLETEMVTDPLLLEVGWSWVRDALEAREVAGIALSATVSRAGSQSFGDISDRNPEGSVELRASWTVAPDESVENSVLAWCDLLAAASGLEPLPEGVTSLHMPGRR
jgi:hypothetical protein